MTESMEFLKAYGQTGLFFLFGIIFAAIGLVLAWLVRARNDDPIFNTTYECGSETIGPSQVQINIRFYIFALLFVLFDVEAVFVYPWAVNAKNLGISGFAEMAVFLGVLLLGLAYAWKKGVLKWE